MLTISNIQTGVTITKFPITITITSKMSGFFERKITLNDRQNEWDCLSFDYQSRKSLGNCNSFGFGIDTALAAAAAPIFPFSRGRGAHFPIFTAVRSLGKGNRDWPTRILRQNSSLRLIWSKRYRIDSETNLSLVISWRQNTDSQLELIQVLWSH